MPTNERVLNPETNKHVKVNGPIFTRLIKSGYRYDSDANQLVAEVDSVEPEAPPSDQEQREPPRQAQEVVALTDRRIDHLVHISDVHIPINLVSNGRKEEYLGVFQRLYEQIRELRERHPHLGIAITGDLLHTKIKLEPESIITAREFLLSLTEIAPTFLITGNHDMNEYNLDQRCTLSAICHNLSERLYYLEWSGLYQIGEHLLVVSSLKDQVFIRHRDIPPELIGDRTAVYLYHGYLSGAKTDTGYQQRENPNSVSSRFRSVRDFEGFPLVLLGDVHKQQSMRSDGTMAYAGSLLQLDRSESLDRHGFLVWDIGARTYQFHQVKNDFGFVKIRVSGGEIDPNSLDKVVMPKKPVIYCHLNQTTLTQFEQIRHHLQAKYRPVDIRLDNKLSYGHQLTSLAKEEDIKPVSLDEEIEMIKTSGRLIEDDLEPVIALHKRFDGQVKRDQLANYHAWDLLKLEFKNIFIYGQDRSNVINFQSGITNITAPNRNGKSSICHMIMFALFHKTSHDITQKSDILNKWAKEGYIHLHFRHDNQQYLIAKSIAKQKRTGRKSEDSDIYKTDFYRLNEGERIKLNGTTSTETIEEIQKYVGTFDNFIANNTLLTRLSHSILYQKPTDRIKRFLNLFLLDCYEQHLKLSRESSKLVREEVSQARADLKSLETLPKQDLKRLEEQHEAKKATLRIEKGELNMYTDEIDELQQVRQSLEDRLLELRANTVKVEQPEESLADLRLSHEELKEALAGRSKPSQSLELLVHQQQQLKVNRSETLTGCRQEYEQMQQLKPCRSQEKLESLLQALNRQEQELAVERRVLSNQLSEVEHLKRSDELDDESLSIDDLKEQQKGLKEKLDPVPFKRSEVEKRVTELRRHPFERLKRRSVDTTEELISELLVETGQLRGGLLPEGQTSKCAVEGDRYQEKIDELSKQCQELPEIPPLKTDYQTGDLEAARDRLRVAEANIAKLEKITGQIDLKATTERLRQLVSQEEISITRQFGETLIKILDLSAKGTFRQLALNQSQREQEEQKLAEIGDALEHNRRIRDLLKENEARQAYNRRLEREINFVRNLMTQSGIDQHERRIKSLRYQIQLIKKRDELNEAEEHLRRIASNEAVEGQLLELEMRINQLNYKALRQRVEENRVQLIELVKERRELAEELEWYQQLENLTAKLGQLEKYRQLQEEIELHRQFERLEQLDASIQHHEQFELNRSKQTEISDVTRQLDQSREQHTKIEQTVNQYKQSIFVLEQDLARLKQEIEATERTEARRSQLTVQLVDHERALEHHKRYQDLWSSKGLPLLLLKKKLKLIEPMINELFTRYTGYALQFEVFDETKLLVGISCQNGKGETTQLGLDRLSGSEYSILNLAFKSVCNKLSPYGRSTLFVIDESFDCLDRDNWKVALPDIFQMMKTDYLTVLFISHRNIPEELIDHQIKIRKTANNSEIIP
jgi:DNA repair exonuclease SbcCD ATPase subunit